MTLYYSYTDPKYVAELKNQPYLSFFALLLAEVVSRSDYSFLLVSVSLCL